VFGIPGADRDVGERSARLDLTSNRRQQVIVPKWFGQKRELRRDQPQIHELGGEAAHEHDGKTGVQASQSRGKLAAVHNRHSKVGKHQAHLLIRPMSEQLERTRAIGSFQYRIALILKQAPYDATQTILILDHEDGAGVPTAWAFAVHANNAR
jgi:hypothetical protein